MRQGRRRLAALLPKAKAALRSETKNGLRFEARTSLAQSMMPHVRENRLEALCIYPAPLGGWHADILFKGMPPGVPNSFGSPVGQPYTTREEAEENGYQTLLMTLRICEENKRNTGSEKASPVFMLYSGSFDLSTATYDALLAAHPAAKEGYGSISNAIERVEEFLSEHMPGVGHDSFKDRFNAFSRDLQLRLISILHIAALSGLYAYPPRQHGKPKTENQPNSAH